MIVKADCRSCRSRPSTISELYDSPQTLSLIELQIIADVESSRRCINCGGYAGDVLDEPAPCTCKGDYRPTWRVAQDEIKRRATIADYDAWLRSREEETTLTEDMLELIMRAQMQHVHRMTADLHLSDDGCDYLDGALRLAADLLDAWYNSNGDRAREILTEDYLLGNYACDGISRAVLNYVKRVAPSDT